ncbi:MAG: hypothetical protein AAFQ27_04625 [Pseudomonadota bacterium]
MISTWNAPLSDGKDSEELLLAFDENRPVRVLILPAWFDEANKLRRFTVEVMRRLDGSGIDSFLPDLPGCNESLAQLSEQTIASWREAAGVASAAFSTTHVLTLRAGAILAPTELSGWRYAPQTGPKQLRGMVRARTIASREQGKEETTDDVVRAGRESGVSLGGWAIGPAMFSELETAGPTESDTQVDIAQATIGGPGLWLRAEPDYDATQADALAAIIALSVGDRV